MANFAIKSIGKVESELREPKSAPKQADEGAPPAWLVFEPTVGAGLRDIRVGDELILITWLHHADRTALTSHPRGDVSRPAQGVFSTRSPHRPNPIGLHTVEVISVDDLRLQVSGLEAVDGTPIVDLKPVLDGDPSKR